LEGEEKKHTDAPQSLSDEVVNHKRSVHAGGGMLTRLLVQFGIPEKHKSWERQREKAVLSIAGEIQTDL